MSKSRDLSVRIGITLKEQTDFKHLLTLRIIRDGGVTLTPAAASPNGWEVTAGTAPTEAAPGMVETVSRQERSAGFKLHYHRSGLVSIKFGDSGTEERVWLRRLDDASYKQIFSFYQRRPSELSWQERKGRRGKGKYQVGDSYVVVDEWPEGVGVLGTMVQHKAVPWLHREFEEGLDGAVRVITGDRDYLVFDLRGYPDLEGRLLDACLVVTFLVDPVVNAGTATTTVTGMCTDGTPSGELVRIHSADGWPRSPALLRGEMPEFPRKPGDRAKRDRELVIRDPGGPVVSRSRL